MYYIQIDKSIRKSYVQQIVTSIEQAIYNKILKDQDQLPTVSEISSFFEISDIAVRMAYQDLQKKNLIHSIKGKGTFVSLRPYRTIPLKTFYDQKHYLLDSTDSFFRRWLYTNKEKDAHLLIKLHATLNGFPIYHQKIKFYRNNLDQVKSLLTEHIHIRDFFIRLNHGEEIVMDNLFSPKSADLLDVSLLQIKVKDPVHKIVTKVYNKNHEQIAEVETLMPAKYISFEVLL